MNTVHLTDDTPNGLGNQWLPTQGIASDTSYLVDEIMASDSYAMDNREEFSRPVSGRQQMYFLEIVSLVRTF